MTTDSNPPAIAAAADPSAAPAAPVSPVVSTPTAETPPAAPAAAESSSAAPKFTTFLNEAPKAEDKPVEEPKPAEEPKTPEAPKEEPKPAEGDKPAEVPKEEANQSDKPAPLPAYEPWTLPEGVTLDDKQATEFSSLLGELQTTTKAEQALIQKFGQTLVDKHLALTKENLERLHEGYQNSWLKQNEDWKEAFIKDPEIGGKRQETTLKAANEFISTHGGTPAQQKEFRDLMGNTGMGNHPAVIRLLSNAMAKFSESKQPAPMHFPAERQSKPAKWYGKKA